MNAAVRTRTRETAGECPECGGRVQQDGIESVCASCGLVTDERRQHPAVGHRLTDATDPYDDGGRHRGPFMHAENPAWGSYIGFTDGLDDRQTVAMRRQHNRAMSTKRERRRTYARREIGRMASAGGYGETVVRTAHQLFKQAHDADYLVGRSIEAVATAALVASARIHGQGLPFARAARLSRVEADRIWSAYTVLNGDMGVAIPPPTPTHHVAAACGDLGVPTSIETDARQIAEAATDTASAAGLNPASVAAAAIYLATRRTITQERICTAVDSTPNSLRKAVAAVEAAGVADD